MPKIKVIEQKTYTIDELRDRVDEDITFDAYDNAICLIAGFAVSDSDWYESIFYDAEDIGFKIEGFDIDRGSYVDGRLTMRIEDVCDAILKNHGEMCETHKLARATLRDCTNARAFGELCDWYGLLSELAGEYDGYGSDAANDYIGDTIEPEFVKDLQHYYLTMLRAEHEYQTSEEQALESIAANGYTFDCDGGLSKW